MYIQISIPIHRETFSPVLKLGRKHTGIDARIIYRICIVYIGCLIMLYGKPVTIPRFVRLPAFPNNLSVASNPMKFARIIRIFNITKTIWLSTGISVSSDNVMNFEVKNCKWIIANYAG